MEPAERRRDLEARVYGARTPDPADVAALRALLAHGAHAEAEPVPSREGGGSAPVRAAGVQELAAPPPSPDADGGLTPPGRRRPATSWFAAAAACVVVAALAGAGVTQAIGRASSDSAPAAASSASAGDPDPVSTLGLAGNGLGAVAAGDLGSEYFDQRQTAADRPPLLPDGIDGSTTRRVLAQFSEVGVVASDAYGIWVARGSDGSFCLLMEVGRDRAASSCAPESAAARSGVRLELVVSATMSVQARWNIADGILQVSPVDLARTAAPTP